MGSVSLFSDAVVKHSGQKQLAGERTHLSYPFREVWAGTPQEHKAENMADLWLVVYV